MAQAGIEMREVEALRRRHKPKDVRVLFVGESPPAGGTFFYAANSNLFRATSGAFAEAFGRRVPRREAFLAFFREAGCYLDDLCLEPVNRMDGPARRRARSAGEAPLAAKLRRESPAAVVAVALSIESHVARALKQAGLGGIPCHCVAFPAMGHQRRFAAELVPILREFGRREILRISAAGGPSPVTERPRSLRDC